MCWLMESHRFVDQTVFTLKAVQTREVLFHSRSHSHMLMNNVIGNLRKKHTVPYLELAII